LLKKREITLKLKKVKIADLTILSSIMGGTGTNNDCNNGGPGTEEDSRKICGPGTDGAGTGITCPSVCPSLIVSVSFC
jgi:hypothetical protein